MPINFQSPTPHPAMLWRKPDTWAVLAGITIEASGFAWGVLAHSDIVMVVALSATALLGAAFTLAKRG